MATATEPITSTEDYLDTRDIIERIEHLEHEPDTDEPEELALLKALIEELRGNSGDSGDTPEDGIQLIRDSYFQEYAEELATDIGAINEKITGSWPLNHIDWEAAANELKVDYTSIEFDGVTYLYR